MKDDSVYLIHVLECIKQIEEYTINGREEFMNSRVVARNLVEIKEHLRGLLSNEILDF